ncbi:hypothetical protein SAMD00019534_032870 [Acytostelium subglobosum LB1]|uniref:hypothetical protein n=1 Tax=Acytostelium subglobosum LB1 TaxID=1410327 RepID=UPI000644D6A1|nr:hypothetical protein SAMD00019534_032870 [Acytostelium subglobosum LB1]GAM20112.1 hypothetical protein SAMD00019534_032870 [Acytostelium subglobosum LB1]|eukprot:XP_012756874.1 hypothetical protein SAMD00019534_032870 [Acytostelium subglobosum LB1]
MNINKDTQSQYFIGVDVGSASVRAGLFDDQGQRLSFAVNDIQVFRGVHSHDVVEQSSQDIWNAVCRSVKQVLQQAPPHVPATSIKGLGFDATCSMVVIDHNGQPLNVSPRPTMDNNTNTLHDIIMWMDHRATKETSLINSTKDPALMYVGGEVSVEMELPKALWLKNNLPQTYKDAWRLFDLSDYLVWRATGVDAVGICTLSCKWNYLSHEGRFSETLLRAVDLEDILDKIPTKVIGVGQPVGTLSRGAAHELGLSEEVVVASGLIDAHAGGLAMIGQSPDSSLALISGTSNCHMLVSRDPLMVPGVWGPYLSAMIPDLWLSEGDHHHGNRSPHSNPHSRAVVMGQTLEQGWRALARLYLATLQSIAYGTRQIIEAIEQAGGTVGKVVLCGGASKNRIWMREYANITNRAIGLMVDEDAVTLGAAIVAAVACGSYTSIQEACSRMAKLGASVEPKTTIATKSFHDLKYQVYLKMYNYQLEVMDTINKHECHPS